MEWKITSATTTAIMVVIKMDCCKSGNTGDGKGMSTYWLIAGAAIVFVIIITLLR